MDRKLAWMCLWCVQEERFLVEGEREESICEFAVWVCDHTKGKAVKCLCVRKRLWHMHTNARTAEGHAHTRAHFTYGIHVQSVVIINHAISSPQIRVTEIHCICGISPTIQRGCTTALFNVSPDGRLGEGGIESKKLCVQHGVRTLNRALKSAPLW